MIRVVIDDSATNLSIGVDLPAVPRVGDHIAIDDEVYGVREVVWPVENKTWTGSVRVLVSQ